MELYSKACVAESIRFVVDKAKEESANLEEYENFSCNLATILARDREVVAVRLLHHADKCDVYLAKNSRWTDTDVEYIEEIKEYVKSLSNDAPIKLDDALRREDVRKLFKCVLKYCSAKINNRFEKLKGGIEDDIKNNKQDPYIRAFMDYANINAENIGGINGHPLGPICSNYYKEFQSSSASAPVNLDEKTNKFLRHIRKVGSYYASLIDITACACESQYKLQFADIRVRRIDPVINYQPISSWKDTVQRYTPEPAKYEEVKMRCLNDKYTLGRLTDIYGSVDELDNENIKQRMYLHAEMNLLKNIVDHPVHNKGKEIFIAVSKRCCYLCESYIRFINRKGYKICTSGAHKKLYSKWLLPELKDITLKNESLNYMIKQLDQVISKELAEHVSIVARSYSDGDSVKTKESTNVRKIGFDLYVDVANDPDLKTTH